MNGGLGLEGLLKEAATQPKAGTGQPVSFGMADLIRGLLGAPQGMQGMQPSAPSLLSGLGPPSELNPLTSRTRR